MTPRTPDPALAPPLRWGVMGTGWIVERFVDTVRRNTRQRFTAVGSRDGDRAVAAARRLGIPYAHGSYADLAADPEVDVVYVGTGHLDHHACARTALELGKPVLVEKPIAPNAEQAADLAELAAERGVFCAEALWSAFLPRWDVVRQVLEQGALGDVRTVLADNGEWLPPDHRIFDPAQAGGPMLDLGTYPFALAAWVLGEPVSLRASAQPHPSGVHGQVGAVLTDAEGRQAVLHTTVFGDTPTAATISGTRATLTLPGRFYQPGDVVLTQAGGTPETIFTEPPIAHEALFHQAAEVARRVAAGQRETPLRPLAASVATLRTMDAVRGACGLRFPGEG